MESVELVRKAYDIFSRAEAGMETDAELLHLYMNRGNVSLSVPEIVFNKSIQGAEDFISAAEIYRQMGADYSGEAGSALYRAGVCYENAGKAVMAEIAFARAAAETGLDAETRYQLALRGY